LKERCYMVESMVMLLFKSIQTFERTRKCAASPQNAHSALMILSLIVLVTLWHPIIIVMEHFRTRVSFFSISKHPYSRLSSSRSPYARGGISNIQHYRNPGQGSTRPLEIQIQPIQANSKPGPFVCIFKRTNRSCLDHQLLSLFP